MTMLRIAATGLLAVSLAATASGCWTRAELNERAFVRLMLLDKTENGFELTLGFPLPNRMPGGTAGGTVSPPSEPPFTLITKVGRDIGEAFRLIQADLSRRITFGQLRSILISNSFAQSGVFPILDFLNRNPEIHINTKMFVTDGPARKIGNIPLTFERFVTDILTAYAKQGMTLDLTAKDVLMAVVTDEDFVLPILVFGQPGATTENKSNNWLGTDGAAVFRQGKMVATMGPPESHAVKWIMGMSTPASVQIPSPSDGKPVSLLLYNNRSKISPVLEGERIRFVVSCKGSARIVASQSTLDVTDRSQLDALERKLNQDVQRRIRKAFSFTQVHQSDVFGLGQRIRWRRPDKWNRLKDNWRSIYQSQVAIEPKADIHVKWFGGAKRPVWNRVLLSEEEQK